MRNQISIFTNDLIFSSNLVRELIQYLSKKGPSVPKALEEKKLILHSLFYIFYQTIGPPQAAIALVNLLSDVSTVFLTGKKEDHISEYQVCFFFLFDNHSKKF